MTYMAKIAAAPAVASPLEVAIEQSTDMFVRLALDGTIRYTSAAAETLYGYDLSDLVGLSFDVLSTENDRERVKREYARLGSDAEHVTCVHYLLHKDGRKVAVETVFDLVRAPDAREPFEIVGVVRRVAGRMAATDPFVEERYRLLVSEVVDYAIYMLDLEGNLTSWNGGGENIKGYRMEEIVGRNFSTFYTREDVERGEPARALNIARTAGKFAAEGWRVRKDGTLLWASVVIDAIRSSAGELVGFAKVTFDATERHSAARKLDTLLQRMSLATQAAKVGIWELDVPTMRFLWDANVSALYLQTADGRVDVAHDVWFAAVHPDDRERVEHEGARARMGAGPFEKWSFESSGRTARSTTFAVRGRPSTTPRAARLVWSAPIGTSPKFAYWRSGYGKKRSGSSKRSMKERGRNGKLKMRTAPNPTSSRA